MAQLPTGTITFLFTDIAGSTQLLQRLGSAYAQSLGERQRLLRQAFVAHDGAEVDTLANRAVEMCGTPAIPSSLVSPLYFL